jgi:hypothetical protein
MVGVPTEVRVPQSAKPHASEYIVLLILLLLACPTVQTALEYSHGNSRPDAITHKNTQTVKERGQAVSYYIRDSKSGNAERTFYSTSLQYGPHYITHAIKQTHKRRYIKFSQTVHFLHKHNVLTVTARLATLSSRYYNEYKLIPHSTSLLQRNYPGVKTDTH